MITTTLPLILASQSAQRQAILAGLGIEFTVHPANIDELAIQHPDHHQRIVKVAREKAHAIAIQYPKHLILSGDTYVLCEGKSFEKPINRTDAIKMLTFLSDKKCQEITGVCLLNTLTGSEDVAVIPTEFTFRKLSSQEIDHYVTEQPVLQWSAAFSPAYAAGAALIASVAGSLTSFTHGMPVEWVMEKLQARGYIAE